MSPPWRRLYSLGVMPTSFPNADMKYASDANPQDAAIFDTGSEVEVSSLFASCKRIVVR